MRARARRVPSSQFPTSETVNDLCNLPGGVHAYIVEMDAFGQVQWMEAARVLEKTDGTIAPVPPHLKGVGGRG